MKILASLLIVLFSLVPLHDRDSYAPPYDSIDNNFRLRWKSKIGNASFRTNMYVGGGYVIVGSNGDYFMDWNIIDKQSGLYILNAKTGKPIAAMNNRKWGDFDLNGLLVIGNKIYFGNDNEEFMCVDFKGNIIWKNLASGDIESEPVLIDIKGKKVIVYATELGEVRAVDPLSGKSVWSYFSPDFTGWKESENRKVFKVRAFLSDTKSFFTKPAVGDINSDGINDVTYVGYNNRVYSISGADGSLLWSLTRDDSFRGDFIEYHSESIKPEIWIPVVNFKAGARFEEVGLSRVSSTGQLLSGIHFQFDNAISHGLNSFQISGDKRLYSTNDSVFMLHRGKKTNALYIGDNFSYKSSWSNDDEVENRNFRGMLFGTSIFNYKGKDSCIVILSQRDLANLETGFIQIISLKEWRVIDRFSLRSGSEMPPQIMDIDNDGKKEILFSCYDGNLYCYNL
jgi:hypothetical protein